MNIQKLFPNGGFYIEAGAHDGIGDSNTYALEKTGLWRGICIEPSSAFTGLQKHRKCAVDNGCLWSVDGAKVVFRQVSGDAIELSGIKESFCDNWDRETRLHQDLIKETISLTTLLILHNAPSIIEYLCLDTEGSEYEILRTHKFDRFKFLVMQIEHNHVELERAKLRNLLEPLGYIWHPGPSVEDWYTWPSLDLSILN